MALIEQHGNVRIIDNKGRLLPEPFLDMQARIRRSSTISSMSAVCSASLPSELSRATASSILPIRSRCAGAELDRRLWWSHTNVVAEFQVSKARSEQGRPDQRADRLADRLAAVQPQRALDRLRSRQHALRVRPATVATPTTGASATTSCTGNGQDLTSIHGKILRHRRQQA